MAAKNFCEFMEWYRKEWGFDPEPLSIWGAAIKFAEEKFTSTNKQSTPCTWKCACGQEVVGDYCKCGAYRCDL